MPPAAPPDVASITWTIPPFPTIFASYTHVQKDWEELPSDLFGPPVTVGQVYAVSTPNAADKVQSLFYCVGPVHEVFSFTATVALTTGESGTATVWLRGWEQTVVGMPSVSNPTVGEIQPPNPNAGSTVLAPADPVVIEATGDPDGPDGDFAFVQLVDVTGYFKLKNGDEWNRNTSGSRVDFGSTDRAFMPLPDQPGLTADDLCDPMIVGWCKMVDQPYVGLIPFQKDTTQAVDIGYYSFSAQVWVMFIPRSLGEPVPVAKATWSWHATVQYEALAPNEYSVLDFGANATPFVETNDWPAWRYDTGDGNAWWSRGPLVL